MVDIEIPDRPFTFGQYSNARAAGDAAVLVGGGRHLQRPHLTDLTAGLPALQELLG